uniref:PDZ domain-containing protein n=1 Tax=Panagrolaimus sp. JU765 TaxID=591449 RepID=A0AC34QT92_9BILA
MADQNNPPPITAAIPPGAPGNSIYQQPTSSEASQLSSVSQTDIPPSLSDTTWSPDLQSLARKQESRSQTVTINMTRGMTSIDVVISENMVISSIKPNSCVLFDLIIGDQVIHINGKTPNNPEEAYEMIEEARPRFQMLVNRPGNIFPIPQMRASKISLKRYPDYSYFVVNIEKMGKIHLGLGIRDFNGKVFVNRTDENSLAAFNFLVGDSILDVNGEKVQNIVQVQKKVVESLKKHGSASCVVERPVSLSALHNTRVLTNFFFKNEIDPEMPKDVIGIAQREIVRFRANATNNTLKSVLRKPKGNTRNSMTETSEAGNQERKSKRRKKRRNKKNEPKNVVFDGVKTHEIMSDVPNPAFLTKLKKNQVLASAMTFCPNFLRESFRRMAEQ